MAERPPPFKPLIYWLDGAGLMSIREDVFINCPFDEEYNTLFEAIVFAIIRCGFRARCAKERIGSGDIRVMKIIQIISECVLGVHDLSRVELSKAKLPRFNMPFELGLFMGAQHFGDADQRKKDFLIVDSKPNRFKIALSDISGQDIEVHDNKPDRLIHKIVDFLGTKSGRTNLPDYKTLVGEWKKLDLYLENYATEQSVKRADIDFAILKGLILKSAIVYTS